MDIRFMKISPDATRPFHGSAFAAGYDLTAVSVERDEKNEVDIYHTGMAFEIPKGFFGLLVLRSSSFRMGQRLSMGAAIIDSDFRGEVIIPLDRRGGEHPLYEIGNRLAQLVIVPCVDAEWRESLQLAPSERGAGGYGSTGR